MILRQVLHEAGCRASCLVGGTSLGRLAVVDPHADLVEDGGLVVARTPWRETRTEV